MLLDQQEMITMTLKSVPLLFDVLGFVGCTIAAIGIGVGRIRLGDLEW